MTFVRIIHDHALIFVEPNSDQYTPGKVLVKTRIHHSRSQSPPFLLVTWSAKRGALVTLTTGCREF